MPPLDLPFELTKENLNPRWNQTFFKLQIFNLIQFQKIVFLDLDMIVVRNIDELFQKPHMSAVAAGHCVHDSWTGLNSGLMVIEPCTFLYNQLIHSIPAACEKRQQSGNGFGDQDVINYCFPQWWEQKELILPEIYNGVSFDFEEICKVLGYSNLRVIHYAEARKPWDVPAWRMYRHIIFSVCKGNFNRARMCYKYWRYVKKSCPDYLKYSWH